MSPIEHYFENLLTMGSDIKGEPNKNALSKEVQEAVEICADYVKYDLLLENTKAKMVSMLEKLKKEIIELPFPQREPEYMQGYSYCQMNILDYVIQQKINKLKEK